MAAKRRKAYSWIRRPNTERRVHARVALEFPLDVALNTKTPSVPATVLDVGLGGVRVRFDRYLELFTRFNVSMHLPVSSEADDMEMETISTSVAVVRIEPDEEGPPETEYTISLAFTRLSEADQRVIAMFMLQRLLYDPDAELL